MREGQKDHCLNCNDRIVWTEANGWLHENGGRSVPHPRGCAGRGADQGKHLSVLTREEAQ